MVTAVPDKTPVAAPPDSAKRRQILDGARTVFLAQGFDGASMGEIARVAGVSKGTLYVYFDSKETLFEALTIAERGSLAEALFRLDEDDPDTRAVLRRLGVTFLEMMMRPDHVSSVRMVIGAVDKFPRFGRAFYESGPEVGTRRLAAYLDRQVAAGRLSIDDTRRAAQQFLNLCASQTFKRLLFGVVDTIPSAEDNAVEVDVALRMFFASYGPPAASAASPPKG
jgi:AcrR family transcriptional regulator